MPDITLTIDYSVTGITNTADGLSTIVWSMSEATTMLTEAHAGDKFNTAELTQNILTSSDDGGTKINKVEKNFRILRSLISKLSLKECALPKSRQTSNILTT